MDHGEFPGEIEHWSMVVVYDPTTGTIVHAHQCMTSKGGEHPDKETLERQALEFASQGKRASAKRMAALHVDPRTFNKDKQYKVDVKKGVLVEMK